MNYSKHFLGLLLISLALGGTTVSANEPVICVLQQNAAALECAALDMRDEIKTHFCQTKCYRKLLTANTRIKLTSAAMQRRLKRNPCYRGLGRDVAELRERTCELVNVFNLAIENNRCAKSRHCIEGDTQHVAHKILAMVEISDCLTATFMGTNVYVSEHPPMGLEPIFVEPIIISEIGANPERMPAVSPAIAPPRISSNISPGLAPEPAEPGNSAPTPAFRSVLER